MDPPEKIGNSVSMKPVKYSTDATGIVTFPAVSRAVASLSHRSADKTGEAHKKAPAAQAFDKSMQVIDISTIFNDFGVTDSTIPPD